MASKKKIILTVDPGINAWAWATFSLDGKLLDTKTYRATSKTRQEDRLYNVLNPFISGLVTSGAIVDKMVIENQFHNSMSQIVGVLKSVAGYLEAPTEYHYPKAWKKILTGKGDISEEELRDKVISVYPEAKDFDEHQIDCLAIYLAYQKNSKEVSNAKNTKKNKR